MGRRQSAENIRLIHDHAALLADQGAIERVSEAIRNGSTFVARRVIEPAFLREVRDYLTRVGQSSLPNYHPIVPGTPNFHRMNRLDDRAYVKGAFHQFCFFPWNQDVFGLFEKFRPIYRMKNLLSGLPADSFLSREPENGCTARIAFQVYPRGVGFLNPHRDPVDYHQLVVPTLLMSKRGEDYEEGGLYIETEDGRKIDCEAGFGPGDVVYFNAARLHGVDPIDPDAPERWHAFDGRWMALFAVNRIASNTAIADSMDLEEVDA